MILTIIWFLAQVPLVPSGGSSGSDASSTIFVALIGAISVMVASWLTWRATKKKTEADFDTTEKTSILAERQQISQEWKILREYQTLQLTAAQKEIDALRVTVKTQDKVIEDKNALIRQLQSSLEGYL